MLRAYGATSVNETGGGKVRRSGRGAGNGRGAGGGGGGGSDPFFANVVSLLHLDPPAGTTFTDVSSSPPTWSVETGPTISTTQSVFGGASMSIPGTGYIFTSNSGGRFSFGSGDFTIEMRVRFNTLPTAVGSGMAFYSDWYSFANEQGLTWLLFNAAGGAGNTAMYLAYSTNGTNVFDFSVPWAPVVDTWYAIAVTRSGNNCRFFVDGVQLGATQSIVGTINDTTGQNILLGAFLTLGDYLYRTDGWQDEVRITKGTARYTSNYTPATQEFPNSGP